MSTKAKRFTSWLNKGKIFSNMGFCLLFTKNKVLEIELSFQKKPTEWFRMCTQATKSVSQPGFCTHLTLLWYSLEIIIYDKRQWDYKKNKFIEEVTNFKYF
jgi:hypothetical protein